MNGQAKQHAWGTDKKIHHCPRHADLTILFKSARKDICNTCFATLKKSYFNVIAGILLEMHYLHNITKSLIEQNNTLQKQFQDQETHLLNISHEISEIKKGANNEQEPRHPPPAPEEQIEPQKPQNAKTQDPSNICAEGHVAKAAHSLQDLLHIKITRVLQYWKEKKAANTPTTHNIKDSKGTIHTHGGYSMTRHNQDNQDE